MSSFILSKSDLKDSKNGNTDGNSGDKEYLEANHNSQPAVDADADTDNEVGNKEYLKPL